MLTTSDVRNSVLALHLITFLALIISGGVNFFTMFDRILTTLGNFRTEVTLEATLDLVLVVGEAVLKVGAINRYYFVTVALTK
jgi:hypothetical protein